MVIICVSIFLIAAPCCVPNSEGERSEVKDKKRIFLGDLLVPSASSVHPRIAINNNSELDAFCAGNGTDGLSWETAHVIRDLVITGSVSTPAVQIKNIDRYLIIENCTMVNT